MEWRDWRWWCLEGDWVGGGRESEERGVWEGEVDVWRHGCRGEAVVLLVNGVVILGRVSLLYYSMIVESTT